MGETPTEGSAGLSVDIRKIAAGRLGNLEAISWYSRCTARPLIEAELEQELNKDSNLLCRTTGTVGIRIHSPSLEPYTQILVLLRHESTFVSLPLI